MKCVEGVKKKGSPNAVLIQVSNQHLEDPFFASVCEARVLLNILVNYDGFFPNPLQTYVLGGG